MNKSIKLRMSNIFVSFTRTVGVGVGEGHSPTTLAWVDFLGVLMTWIRIDYFTFVYSVAWPLTGSEAGGDLVLIQTLAAFVVQIKLFFC